MFWWCVGSRTCFTCFHKYSLENYIHKQVPKIKIEPQKRVSSLEFWELEGGPKLLMLRIAASPTFLAVYCILTYVNNRIPQKPQNQRGIILFGYKQVKVWIDTLRVVLTVFQQRCYLGKDQHSQSRESGIDLDMNFLFSCHWAMTQSKILSQKFRCIVYGLASSQHKTGNLLADLNVFAVCFSPGYKGSSPTLCQALIFLWPSMRTYLHAIEHHSTVIDVIRVCGLRKWTWTIVRRTWGHLPHLWCNSGKNMDLARLYSHQSLDQERLVKLIKQFVQCPNLRHDFRPWAGGNWRTNICMNTQMNFPTSTLHPDHLDGASDKEAYPPGFRSLFAYR